MTTVEQLQKLRDDLRYTEGFRLSCWAANLGPACMTDSYDDESSDTAAYWKARHAYNAQMARYDAEIDKLLKKKKKD